MSDTAFRIAVATAAVLVGAAIMRLSFCRPVELPAVPPRPPAPRIEVAQVTATVASDPAEYAQRIATDSHALRVDPPATPADLARVMAHQAKATKLALEPKGKKASTEVLGLKLALSVSDIDGTPRRQMVLTIQNTTDHYLAYRVASRPSQGTRPCHEKSDFAHNAIALAPGEKVRRSECIYKRGWRLMIDRVETVELPKLSYFYVSALSPTALGLDRLSSRGHRAVGGRLPCQTFQSAVLDDALRSGATTWRDLIDFYARHPCQVYTFPNGYKAFAADGERPLPAVVVAP